MITAAQANTARPVQERVTWLQERVRVHQFGCNHHQVQRSHWHCQALQWTRRELRQAKEEKDRRDMIRNLNLGLARSVHVFGVHSPMEGTGRDLEAAGRHWHVSPYLIASIAATESSLGVASCVTNKYNAFGLSSCGSGWRVPTFYSWRQAYEFMGQFLASKWPTARTPWDLRGYAACDTCWGGKVAMFMRKLFDAGPEVRYE